jgi:ADP-ribosylation factor protein 6
MPPLEVAELLGLPRMLNGRNWYVHPSNALTGEGLFEGLTWLINSIKK